MDYIGIDNEFFDSVSHQRICHLLKGKPNATQSSEEIQKLSMPLFARIEDAINYIIAKGLPAQFTFVPTITLSSIATSPKHQDWHSLPYARKHPPKTPKIK